MSFLLPPEVWIIVFRWATYPSDGYPAPHYEPFRVSSEALDKSLRTKHSLVQVCRRWRAIATVFLYEDIRVRYDSENLRAILADRRVGNEDSLGKFVHRLELPYIHTVTERPGDTEEVVEILRSCPYLKTLVRPSYRADPYFIRYEFPAAIVSLASLTRLEWWHYNNAARSGGINSLMDVLENAPSLQFLTLGGEFWPISSRSTPLRLPALTTLRLKRVNPFFISQIVRWELPSLVHVVVEFPTDHGGLEELWLRLGSQLCTVEFSQHLAFHMTDQISPFLRSCAGAKVFNYFINFTAPPTAPVLVEQSSLECIGIHSRPCDPSFMHMHDNWMHLKHLLQLLPSRSQAHRFVWGPVAGDYCGLAYFIIFGTPHTKRVCNYACRRPDKSSL